MYGIIVYVQTTSDMIKSYAYVPGLCNAVDGQAVFGAKMRIDIRLEGKKCMKKTSRTEYYRKTRMAFDIELLLLNTTHIVLHNISPP